MKLYTVILKIDYGEIYQLGVFDSESKAYESIVYNLIKRGIVVNKYFDKEDIKELMADNYIILTTDLNKRDLNAI